MTQETAPFTPRRLPKQGRSRELVRAIREAATIILSEKGSAELSTRNIAERAGIGIASLYRYYPNINSILADLYECKLAELNSKLQGLLRNDMYANMDLATAIRTTVGIHIQFQRDLLEFHEDFYRSYCRNFDIKFRPGPEGAENWEEWVHQWTLKLFETHRNELRIDDIERATLLVMNLMSGCTERVVTYYPEMLWEAEFCEDMIDVICSYLLCDYPETAVSNRRKTPDKQ